MGDSTTLSARELSDRTLLDRARRLRNGVLIETVQSLERKRTALKGSKDGLEKFKGTSLPELRSIAEHSECRWLRRTLMAFRTAKGSEACWPASRETLSRSMPRCRWRSAGDTSPM